MPHIPDDRPVLVRTWFGDDAAWNAVVIETRGDGADPTAGAGSSPFTAVDDRDFDGATALRVIQAARSHSSPYLFLADRTTLTDPEHPVLVVDRGDPQADPPASFRVASSRFGDVESNLSTANVDSAEFLSAADADGVFRGFRVTVEQRHIEKGHLLDAIPESPRAEALELLRSDLENTFSAYPNSRSVQLPAVLIADLRSRRAELLASTFPYGMTPFGYEDMVQFCAARGPAWGLHLPGIDFYWSVVLDIDTIVPVAAMRVDKFA
ncbi:DUF6924 domain-containing protein [Rhodococcoides corynebacterioides]|uniref:DUF6924 domain-containing protein n=1 Tax=Rhodococcoides corynebacterioides TaxID=53972 RepID=UPI001C9A7C32|nr:hypothetical protein [Rhodococcus corynebacterioides]MBY6348758.1 hypothetical protein [Rhodococcus corynebacterioides]